MKCPYCGEENSSGVEICATCGEKIYVQHKEDVELQKAIEADKQLKAERDAVREERSGKVMGCIIPFVLNFGIPACLLASSMYSCTTTNHDVGAGFLFLVGFVAYIWFRGVFM